MSAPEAFTVRAVMAGRRRVLQVCRVDGAPFREIGTCRLVYALTYGIRATRLAWNACARYNEIEAMWEKDARAPTLSVTLPRSP